MSKKAIENFLVKEIYVYLIKKASVGSTVCYEELAMHFGLPSSGNALGKFLSPLLGYIYAFCEDTKQPHVTAIVVRKSGADKGLPGPGFWGLHGNSEYTRDIKRTITKQLHEKIFSYWGLLNKNELPIIEVDDGR